MKFRKFLIFFLLLFLISVQVLWSYDIDILSSGNLSTFNQIIASFTANISATYQILHLSKGEDRIYATIKVDPPKVFFVIGGKALNFVLKKFPSIPVVYSMVLYENRLPSNLPQVTGVHNSVPLNIQVKKIHQSLPGVKTIGIMYTKFSSNSFSKIKKYAAKYGIKVIGIDVSDKRYLSSRLQNLMDQTDAFWLLFDPLFLNATFLKFAILTGVTKNKTLIGFSPIVVKAGAAIAVAPDYGKLGIKAAKLVEKILKGVRPDHLPKEDPPSAIYINMIIAKRVNISFPLTILKKAIVFK